MSAILAINSNSNSPTDPTRLSLKTNGISQLSNKTAMSYSPLALANGSNINNNNNHLNNNNSNTGSSTSTGLVKPINFSCEEWSFFFDSNGKKCIQSRWFIECLYCAIFFVVQVIGIMERQKIQHSAKLHYFSQINTKIIPTIKCAYAKRKVILVSAAKQIGLKKPIGCDPCWLI